MSGDNSANGAPEGPDQLGGNADPSGGSPTTVQAHQAGPTGNAAASDTVDLMDGVAQAYAGFDPAQHAVDAAGRPLLKKGGGFQRKRGRKPGEGGTPSQGGEISPAQSAPATVGAKIDNAQMARICAANLEMLGMAVFGEEWEVTDVTEQKTIVAGFESYLKAIGGVEVSPSWGLAFTIGGYAFPRVKKPNTKAKLISALAWLRGKFRKG